MPIFDEVHAAMERGELFLEYMPTVALADGRCVGAEALVRWQRGSVVVPAADFIPEIENTPLSGMITYWVIDRVAAELGDWLGANSEAHISINVPPDVLGRGGLDYAASRTGLRARAAQIVLEITERGIPDRLGLDALNLMADQGIRLALDDTTLSGVNLALVARSNFRIIKLDRLVTAQLELGKPSPPWLAGLRALLKSSPLQVVAEGIETEYQAKWLRQAGVQLGQGHYFSLPLPARELEARYADDRRRPPASP